MAFPNLRLGKMRFDQKYVVGKRKV